MPINDRQRSRKTYSFAPTRRSPLIVPTYLMTLYASGSVTTPTPDVLEGNTQIAGVANTTPSTSQMAYTAPTNLNSSSSFYVYNNQLLTTNTGSLSYATAVAVSDVYFKLTSALVGAGSNRLFAGLSTGTGREFINNASVLPTDPIGTEYHSVFSSGNATVRGTVLTSGQQIVFSVTRTGSVTVMPTFNVFVKGITFLY